MKKILFLLLVTIASYGQTYQNPTFGTITTKTAPTTTADPFVSSINTSGVIGKVAPENIPVNVIPPTTHYTPTTPTLKGHFQGLDNAIGNIPLTTAGNTTRVWFTGDATTITAGTFYLTNPSNKGTVANVSQSVINDDNQKKYFTQDLIGQPFATATLFPPGVYAGNLSASTTPNSAQQRFTVELYKCNNAGTPIASGVAGAPVGDLGVTVILILDSGLLTLADGSVTNVPVSASLASQFSIAVGERIRYHVSSEKVGTASSNITESVWYGSSFNSFIDVPTPITSSGVSNVSTVTGASVTNALDNLKNALPIDETTGTFSNLQALVVANPTGTTINLKPNTIYVQQDALVLKDGNTINGNGATLKRDAQQTTTTTVSANQTSTSITVSSIPTGWKIGDALQLYTDNTFATSSLKMEQIIFSIVGNVITFTSAIKPAVGTTYTWPIGTIVRKVFSQITSTRSTDLYTVPTAWTVKNLIVDGNKTNNTGNYYWAVNMAVAISGKSKLEKCTFLNMPNECVMGSGISILNCYAQDLNGSFLHQSALPATGESVLGGEISGNSIKTTNTQSIASGHSEAVITFSFTSGRVKIHDNRFLGGSGSVLGNISSSVDATDGSNQDMFFHDNYCEGYTKIINNFGFTASPLIANVDNVFISDNVFSNCGANDYSGYTSIINNFGAIKFTRNVASNGTTIINVPVKMQELDSFSGLTLNYIPKSNGASAIFNSSIFDNGTSVGIGTATPNFSAANRKTLDISGTSSAGLAMSSGGVANGFVYSDPTLTVFGSLTNTPIDFQTNSTSRLGISNSGTVTINNLSGTGTRTVVADASGNLSALKKYVANLSQSGTSAPTATVIENSIGSIVWTRTSTGNYVATLSGAFTSGKTSVIISSHTMGTVYFLGAHDSTTSTIDLITKDVSNNFVDGFLTATIEITVRP